jgi:putative heme-binding domain-containing protein
VADSLEAAASDTTLPPARRVKALTLLAGGGRPVRAELAARLLGDREADVRAAAVWLLGFKENLDAREPLLAALKDSDAFVRRRACEALVRRGIEPPVEAVWPLLAEKDPYLRTAARLVVQRIDPEKWTPLVWDNRKGSDLQAMEGIVALCKIDRATPYTEAVFGRLSGIRPGSAGELLGWLRTAQLALFHTKERPGTVQEIAERCLGLFPHSDWRVNRELAILLTYFRKEGILQAPVHARLLDALESSAGDRPQQIHYFYCLRLLHDGWTAAQKDRLLAWYDGTKTWTGGHSFTPFLENILRDAAPIFTAEDVTRAVVAGDREPLAAGVLLRVAPEKDLPPDAELGALGVRLAKVPDGPGVKDLKDGVVAALGKRATPEARAALRHIADTDHSQHVAVARVLMRFPSEENFPYLVRGLDTQDKLMLLDLIEALKKTPARPKAEDPAPYRDLLLAAGRLDPGQRWAVVELLRHWSGGRQFGAEDGEWRPELSAWSRWFGQAFPKEPPLPDVAAERPAESKYRFDELLTFLQGEGRSGDPARGRVVFEKAQCIKCHKYGKDGEGVGPDLTTLSKRFKRADVLESIVYPSKVISDQYRSTRIVTRKGVQLNGLVAVQGDTVTVLLSDATRVTLKKSDVEQQFASLVSVMPEKLLDGLSKPEIADLFAFLESEPR